MRRKTHDEFVNELKTKNPTIEVLGKYVNTDTKIKVRCKICGHVWFVRPSDLLRKNNTGCPKCNMARGGLKRTKTQLEFEEELSAINKNIEVLGEYINNHTAISVKCKICGNVWCAKPNALTSQHSGCPKCSMKLQIKKRTKSHETFIEELNKINPNIEVLEKYINNHTKIKCKCKVCGYVWYAIPNDLICKRNTGCPNCNISKGEKRINDYLELYGIERIPQKKFESLLGMGNGQLSYDFYLPDYNLLIEYQGQFHDGSIKTGYQTKSKLEKQQEHDKRKRNYAKENNIDLLEIWYWDFDNIEQILGDKLHINNDKKSVA